MKITTTTNFQEYLDKGINYNEYYTEFEKKSNLVKQGKTKDIPYSEYYILNFQRLKRVSKTVELTKGIESTLQQLQRPITWLVISEFWCGDAAQTLGIIQKITEESQGKITLKLVFRDENPELIDQFLTNGGRSIPKIIQLDSNQEIISDWGPRPVEAQKLVEGLLSEGKSYHQEIHTWYAKDATISTQRELNELLKKAL